MQIKTKFNNLLTNNSDKFYNCINFDNELLQNVQKIYKKKCEKDIKTLNSSYLNELCDENSSNLHKMCDINDICVSLKLKLKIKNKNELDNQNYSIYFDINPGEIMSKNQKKIYYKYKNTTEKNDEHYDHIPREEKMKYFSSLSYKLSGKIIQYKQSKYKLVNLLQSAIYGSVYLSEVIEDSDKSLVNCHKAIKILSKHLIEMTKDKVQEDPLSEYYYRDTMSGHSNILSCDNIFDDNSYIYMVMPFALHGDLFEVMKNRNRAFSEEEGRYLFYQILLAIKFLHSKKMALRDISLENVLLFENEKNGLIYPVLNDPGQAIYFNVNKKNEVVLEDYKKIFGKIFRPPEIYEKCKYDPTKVDIFCAGYILYFCLTKHELFRCALSKDIYWNLFKNKKYEELLKDKKGLHLSEEALDLIFHCLEPNFKKRYNINEALNHPWFKGSFFPIYNFNLYLNHEGSSKYSNNDLFKLSLEIQEYAKKNNMKIDENSTIQFYIYEHVFISPNKSLEKSNTYMNSLNCSSSFNRRKNKEYYNTLRILTHHNNPNSENKITVFQINKDKRTSIIANSSSEDIPYMNYPLHNGISINNFGEDNCSPVFDNNNDISSNSNNNINNNVDNNNNNNSRNNINSNIDNNNDIISNSNNNINNNIDNNNNNSSSNNIKNNIVNNDINNNNNDNNTINNNSNNNSNNNKVVDYKKLFKNINDLNQVSKIKILNNNKKTIYRLIELKKRKKKLCSTFKGTNYSDMKCSDHKMKIRTSHEGEENILIKTKKNYVCNTPRKNNENATLSLLLGDQLKIKNEMSNNMKNEKNIITLIKQHFKENMSKRKSYYNKENNTHKDNNNNYRYTSLNEIRESKKIFLKDVPREIFLNKKNIIKKNKEFIEENPQYKILYNNEDTKKDKNNDNISYIEKIKNSDVADNIHTQSTSLTKNNKKNNNLSIIDNDLITKYGSFELYKKKLSQINNTNKNGTKENKLSEAIHNNIFSFPKKKDTNYDSFHSTEEKYINNILSNEVISSMNNENSKDKMLNKHLLDDNTLKEKELHYKNKNYNIKENNKCAEKKIIKNKESNNFVTPNNVGIKSSFIHEQSSEKAKCIKEERKFSKNNDLNKLCPTSIDLYKCKDSPLINNKIKSCEDSTISKCKELDKIDNILSCKKLNDKNKFTHLRQTYQLNYEKIYNHKTKNSINLLEEVNASSSRVNKSFLENILEKKFEDTSENIIIIESKKKKKSQIQFERELEEQSQEKSEKNSQIELEEQSQEKSEKISHTELEEQSQEKSETETKNEEMKSKDKLECEIENELETIIKDEENNLEKESETDFNKESNDLINEFNDELLDEIENSSNKLDTEVNEVLGIKIKGKYNKNELKNELEKKPKEELPNNSRKEIEKELSDSFENSFSDKCDKISTFKERELMDKEKLIKVTNHDFPQNKSKNNSYTVNNEEKRNLSCKLLIKTKSINKLNRGNYSYNSEKKCKIITSKNFFSTNKEYIPNNKLKDYNYAKNTINIFSKENYSSFNDLNELESKKYNKRNSNNSNEMPIINECKNKKSYSKNKIKVMDIINKKNIIKRYTISETPFIFTNKKNSNIKNILESNNKIDKVIDKKKRDIIIINKKRDKMHLINNFRNTVDIPHYTKKGDIWKIKDSRITKNPNSQLLKENYNKEDSSVDTILNSNKKDNINNRRNNLNLPNKSNMKHIDLKIRKNKNIINKIFSEKIISNFKDNRTSENNKIIPNKINIEQLNKKNFNIDINSKSMKKKKRLVELHQNKISNELSSISSEEIQKSKGLKNRYSVNEHKKLTREDLNKNSNNKKWKNKLLLNINEKKKNVHGTISKLHSCKQVNTYKNNDIKYLDCSIRTDNQNENEVFPDERAISIDRRNNNINEVKNIKENNIKGSNKLDTSLVKKKYLHSSQSNNINYKNSKNFLKPIKSRQTVVYPIIASNNTMKKNSLLIKRNSNIQYISSQKMKNITKIIDLKTENDHKINLNNKSIIESFLSEMSEILEKKNKDNKVNITDNSTDIKNKKGNSKIVKVQKGMETSHLKKTNTSTYVNNNIPKKKEKMNRTTQILNQIYLKKNGNSKLKGFLSKTDINNEEDKMRKNITMRATTNLIPTNMGNRKNNLELIDKNLNDFKKRKTYASYFKKDTKNKINNIGKKIISGNNKEKEQNSNEKEKKYNNFSKEKEQKTISSNFEEKNFFLKNSSEIDKSINDEKNNSEKFCDVLNEVSKEEKKLSLNFNNSDKNMDNDNDHVKRNEVNEDDNDNNNNNSENCTENRRENINKYKEMDNNENGKISNNKNNYINNIISFDNYKLCTNEHKLLDYYNDYDNNGNLKDKNKRENVNLCSELKSEIKNSSDKYVSVIGNKKIINERNTFHVSTTELNRNKVSTYFNNNEIDFNCANNKDMDEILYSNNLKDIKSSNHNLTKKLYANKLKESRENKSIILKRFLNNSKNNSPRNNKENEKFLVKNNPFISTDKLRCNNLGNIIDRNFHTVRLPNTIKRVEDPGNISSININNIENCNTSTNTNTYTNYLSNKKDSKADNKNNFLIPIEEKKNDDRNNVSSNNNNEYYLQHRSNLNRDNFILNRNNKSASSSAINKTYFNLMNKNVSRFKSINNKQSRYLKNKLLSDIIPNEESQMHEKTKHLSSHINKFNFEKDYRNVNLTNNYLRDNLYKTGIKPILFKNLKKEDVSYSYLLNNTNKVNNFLNYNKAKSNIERENRKQKLAHYVFNKEENKKYQNYINNTSYLDPTKSSLNSNNFSYINNKITFSKSNFFTESDKNKNLRGIQNKKGNILIDLNNKINIYQQVKANANDYKNKKVPIKNAYEMIHINRNENRAKSNTYKNESLYKYSPFSINIKKEELASKNLRLVHALEIKKLSKRNADMLYTMRNNNGINKKEVNRNNNNENSEKNNNENNEKNNSENNENNNSENDILSKSSVIKKEIEINNNKKEKSYLNKILNIKSYLSSNILYNTLNINKVVNQKENNLTTQNKNNISNILNTHIISTKLSSILFNKNNNTDNNALNSNIKT